MALPMRPSNEWFGQLERPFRLFEETFGGQDYELYEEDEEFVLTVDMPGYEPEEIEVAWDDGVLNVSAEHVDEDRGRQKTYHQRFRFPKDIEDAEITAQYSNGVLEIRLPLEEGATIRGRRIPVES